MISALLLFGMKFTLSYFRNDSPDDVIVLLAGFSSLYLFKIINKCAEIEKIFLVQAIFVGIMVTILLPPGTVPDECGHFQLYIQ